MSSADVPATFPELMGTIRRMVVEIARGFDTTPSLYTYTLFHSLRKKIQIPDDNPDYADSTASAHSSVRRTLSDYVTTWLSSDDVTTSKTLLIWLCMNSMDARRTQPSSESNDDVSSNYLQPPLLGLQYLRDQILSLLSTATNTYQQQPDCFNTTLLLLLECSDHTGDAWFNVVHDILLDSVQPPVLVDNTMSMLAKQKYEWSIQFVQVHTGKTTTAPNNKNSRKENDKAVQKSTTKSTLSTPQFEQFATQTSRLLESSSSSIALSSWVKSAKKTTTTELSSFLIALELDSVMMKGRMSPATSAATAASPELFTEGETKSGVLNKNSHVADVGMPVVDLAWSLWSCQPFAFCARWSLYRLFCKNQQDAKNLQNIMNDMRMKYDPTLEASAISLPTTDHTFWSNVEQDTLMDPALAWMLVHDASNMLSRRTWLLSMIESLFKEFHSSSPSSTSSSSTSSTSSTSPTHLLQTSIVSWDYDSLHSMLNPPAATAPMSMDDDLVLLHFIELSEIILGHPITTSSSTRKAGEGEEGNRSKTTAIYASGCPPMYEGRVLSLMVSLTHQLVTSTTSIISARLLIVRRVWKEILCLTGASDKIIVTVVVSLLLCSDPVISTHLDSSVLKLCHATLCNYFATDVTRLFPMATAAAAAAAAAVAATASSPPDKDKSTQKYLFHDLDLCLDHISVPSELLSTPEIRLQILEREGITQEEDLRYAEQVKRFLTSLARQNVQVVVLTANSVFNTNYWLDNVVGLQERTGIQILSTIKHKLEKWELMEAFFGDRSQYPTLFKELDMVGTNTDMNVQKNINAAQKCVVFVDDNVKEIVKMDQSAASSYVVSIPSFRPPKTDLGKHRTYSDSKKHLQRVPGVMNQPEVLEEVRKALGLASLF